MKKYRFLKLSDDGIKWVFHKAFPSAYLADRWAMRMFEKWCNDKISFRIVFQPEKTGMVRCYEAEPAAETARFPGGMLLKGIWKSAPVGPSKGSS